MEKNTEIRKVEKCRICESKNLHKFLDLGSMPIPNGFLKQESLNIKEKKYPLACFFCNSCGFVQLTHVVNPKIMFTNYVYIPSGARVMMNNFSNLANQVSKKLKNIKKSLVVDIGSNDGSLLKFFKSYNAKVLGIDPAKNLAKIATKNGIPTEALLFNEKNAKKIVKKWGKATAITATNVIAHIDDLHEVFKSVDLMLDDEGIFVTEFPYLLDLVEKNQFDTIYHEHLSYFSLKPWNLLVEKFGFEIIGVRRLLIHGGSIRIMHKRKNGKKTTKNKTLEYLISLEEDRGLYKIKTYENFAKRLEKIKTELKNLLYKIKKDKKKIIGHGAPAKGNVLMHYFDIGKETLDYIVDSTPYKQGLFTPEKHVPIYSDEKLKTDEADYSLILAWNFSDEIMSKHRGFKKRGGKFIIPIPEVKII